MPLSGWGFFSSFCFWRTILVFYIHGISYCPFPQILPISLLFQKSSLLFICWFYQGENITHCLSESAVDTAPGREGNLNHFGRAYSQFYYHEFSHMVCRTLLNEGEQVNVFTCLLPILLFPYSCLREVIHLCILIYIPTPFVLPNPVVLTWFHWVTFLLESFSSLFSPELCK